jgi:DNA-binding NarL/FixJ family response regulator
LASLPNSDPRIKVLVADAVAMSCRLLADALQRAKRFQVCAVTTWNEALDTLRSAPFQVAVVSSSFAEDSVGGLRLVRELRSIQPQIDAIVLLDTPEPNLVVDAFRSGAVGVFSRADSFHTLCKCIVCVHEGQVWAGSAELTFLLDAFVEPTPLDHGRSRDGSRPLSHREQEIARLVAEGLSNRQISQRLQLSEHTIKNYLFRVFEKLNVSTRVELALHTLKRGRVRRSEPRPAQLSATKLRIRV